VTEYGLPFDNVVIEGPEGAQSLSIQEFLTLSLHRRVQYILGNQLQFYLGKSEVDPSVALHALMKRPNSESGGEPPATAQ
jgi:hypothetical protein